MGGVLCFCFFGPCLTNTREQNNKNYRSLLVTWNVNMAKPGPEIDLSSMFCSCGEAPDLVAFGWQGADLFFSMPTDLLIIYLGRHLCNPPTYAHTHTQQKTTKI